MRNAMQFLRQRMLVVAAVGLLLIATFWASSLTSHAVTSLTDPMYGKSPSHQESYFGAFRNILHC